MTPLLSEALQEAYASASTEDVIVDTLEVVAGTQHLYLCRGFVAITLNDENGDPHVFQPVPFEFNLPGQDSTGAQTLNVGIENVDGTVAAFVQSALLNNTPIVVKYRSYLPNRLITPPLETTVTILGDTYGIVRMPDGKDWLASNFRSTDVAGYEVNNYAPNRLAYGRLYKRNDIVAATLPAGWRVQTVADVDGLVAAITATQLPSPTVAASLKTSGTTYWDQALGTDTYGFGFTGAGWKDAAYPNWYNFKQHGYFAVADPTASKVQYRIVSSTTGTGEWLNTDSNTYAFSYRLVRDPVGTVPDLNPQNPRPLVLTVTAAELTLKGVTFAASVADFVNQPFPNAFYSFTSFPGLR